MTDANTLSPAAKAGAAQARSAIPNKDAPEGSVINGMIAVWADGVLRLMLPREAWSEWLWLTNSAIPSTQQRAQSIRTALDSVGYLQ
ncbi:hypothetical protein [Brevundimonas sp.]|uniref:hypothetical protein n=1 Tax=Brevundimonas sp. TaxID=1871086 RepID=UPI0025C5FFDA|nr:hypothetical protein [Brevundimonas sp.]